MACLVVRASRHLLWKQDTFYDLFIKKLLFLLLIYKICLQYTDKNVYSPASFHANALPSHQAFWGQSGFQLSVVCIGLVPTFQPLSLCPSVYQEKKKWKHINLPAVSLNKTAWPLQQPKHMCWVCISKHGTHGSKGQTYLYLNRWLHIFSDIVQILCTSCAIHSKLWIHTSLIHKGITFHLI